MGKNRIRNDLALVKLDHKLPEDFILPLLPDKKFIELMKIEKNTTFHLYGWGINQRNENPLNLQKMNFNFNYYSQIDKWEVEIDLILSKKDVTNGDSGLPLLFKNNSDYTVVGILSRSTAFDLALNVISMANVNMFKDWIIGTIGCGNIDKQEICKGDCSWNLCNNYCVYGENNLNIQSLDDCKCGDFLSCSKCNEMECAYHMSCTKCLNKDEELNSNCELKN